MATLLAVIFGIGITWEVVAVDAGMLAVLYALLYIFEKREDEKRKYVCFYAGALITACMIIAYCVTIGVPKFHSLLS